MHASAKKPRKAIVLIAVLVVVVLLSLAAYKYSDYMLSEYRATDASIRSSQARMYADSGIHYAAALLAGDQSQTVGGNPWDNVQIFQNVPVGPEDSKFRGRFSILALRSPDELDGGQAYRFGVADEGAKINLNGLLALDRGRGEIGKKVLMGLPNMTEEVAAAILDWMDPDDTPRSNGAESEAYSLMTPAYRCKNGHLDSLEELLLVKGVTPSLLFGNDRNRNGSLDSTENDGSVGIDSGWSAYLTVYSREANADSTNKARVNINGRDLKQLQTQLQTAGVEQTLSTFILAYRLYGGTSTSSRGTTTSGSSSGTTSAGGGASGGQSQQSTAVTGDVSMISDKVLADVGNSSSTSTTKKGPSNRLRTMWDLVSTTITVTIGEGKEAKQVKVASPLSKADQQKELLPILLDKCTTSSRTDLRPRVNVNTASPTVLKAIATASGVSEADMDKIVQSRPTGDAASGAASQTMAWVLADAGLSIETVKKLDPYLCGRTQVYRVQSLGYFERGGPSARIEAVIDTNMGRPRIVYWRDLSELGRGFDVQAPQD